MMMTSYFRAAGTEIQIKSENIPQDGALTMRKKPLAYEYKDKIHEILQKASQMVFVLSALCQINLE